MKKLYLMQHGFALEKAQDLEEGLSEEGKKTVLSSAKALKKIGVNFDSIFCSPKKRSKQTAEIVADIFDFQQSHIIESEKIKAMTPAEETLEVIDAHESVFIAGHLPSIKEMISYLLYPTSTIEIDIKNAGCTYLEKIDGKYHLKWHLVESILKLIP